MQRVKLVIGQDAFLFMPGHRGDLTKGKVEHCFNLWGVEYYVISVTTVLDPVLEVRCGLSVSDAEDKPIGFWRKSNESL